MHDILWILWRTTNELLLQPHMEWKNAISLQKKENKKEKKIQYAIENDKKQKQQTRSKCKQDLWVEVFLLYIKAEKLTFTNHFSVFYQRGRMNFPPNFQK